MSIAYFAEWDFKMNTKGLKGGLFARDWKVPTSFKNIPNFTTKIINVYQCSDNLDFLVNSPVPKL